MNRTVLLGSTLRLYFLLVPVYYRFSSIEGGIAMIAFKAVETRYGIEKVSEIFLVSSKTGMLRRNGCQLAPTRVPKEEMGKVLDAIRASGKKLKYLDAGVAAAFMLP